MKLAICIAPTTEGKFARRSTAGLAAAKLALGSRGSRRFLVSPGRTSFKGFKNPYFLKALRRDEVRALGQNHPLNELKFIFRGFFSGRWVGGRDGRDV